MMTYSYEGPTVLRRGENSSPSSSAENGGGVAQDGMLRQASAARHLTHRALVVWATLAQSGLLRR